MMEGCPVVAKVLQLFLDENTLEEKLTIQFGGDICHKLGDVKAHKIIDNKKYNAYNLFQENTKLKPSTVYRKNLFNLNETTFGAGHRSGVGKSMAALRKISSKARKEISSLEYISTGILKLQEYIIKDKEKQFNATRSFGYPSISHSGLHLSLFDEGLVRLYHLLAPVFTLYFDATGSFISPLPWIRNKDGKPKRILIYTLATDHPTRNAPPLALFEHIPSEHNILSIRQPFLRFKGTELKFFGNCKGSSRIVTDFSKGMMQAVLQEYLGENIAQYLS